MAIEVVSLAAVVGDWQFEWPTGFTSQTWLQILQIIWIDLLLSGDNAVVIALACRALPPHQRRMGILLGAGAAVALRIAFAGVVTQLLEIPYLRLIGGVLLLWIAIKLVLGEDEDDPDVTGHDRLWRAVTTIVIADLLMSLDNVIAIAAAAKGSVWLIAFGVALTIPLIIFGSTFVLSIMTRFPIIVWLGAALLGWISGELIVTEFAIGPQVRDLAAGLGVSFDLLHYLAAAAGAILVLICGWLLRRRKTRTSAKAS